MVWDRRNEGGSKKRKEEKRPKRDVNLFPSLAED